jgi:hypothetical protein
MNVYQKLNEARAKFHQQPLKKSGYNKFAGYSYFELGDFVVPALTIFKEVGLTSVITFKREEAQMLIVNNEKPEEVITIATPMSEASLKGCHPVQNLGAVETYLRRYLWVAAMEIVEHDALDSTAGEKEPAKEPAASSKKIVAKRYLEDDSSRVLFVDKMIEWGDACDEIDALTSLWKANQGQIDELKKDNAEQFKRLQEYFSLLKTNLTTPKE